MQLIEDLEMAFVSVIDCKKKWMVFVGVVNTRKLGYQPIFMNCMGVM